MKLSTRSRYGTRLLLDMAQHYNGEPIHLGVIAKRQNIPVKYLEQIIIPLKKAGYVKSVRGARGGHMLARPPSEVSIAEIVTVLEGGIGLTECAAEPGVCERSATCATRLLWKEISDVIVEKLAKITLQDLANRIEPGPEGMD